MTQVFASAIDADRCELDCLHPERVRPVLGRSLGDDGAAAVASFFGILADPSRARILHLLAIADDLCVCDIALVLGMRPAVQRGQFASKGFDLGANAAGWK